ncbi:hypothetical protein CHLRE_03g167644v5 [Chlamydomonas reinhardtii]|uniref:Uncharacterized protein n=1 Tax=Chlamydomonas reinhardtii TaxID=3055 RepID=A0A2K3DWU2_CHLRE|nr:uncharacterized protein CHLRE_03g167644v5 [Chlamydomonas reinhardtii]PNW85001.1 hypothetical protein CHLRE_03g167644v5 [Chlamydomonas reinhardtii]
MWSLRCRCLSAGDRPGHCQELVSMVQHRRVARFRAAMLGAGSRHRPWRCLLVWRLAARSRGSLSARLPVGGPSPALRGLPKTAAPGLRRASEVSTAASAPVER